MWRRSAHGRGINLVGIFAAVLAFSSLAFPWWGIDVSQSYKWQPGESPPTTSYADFDLKRLNSAFRSYDTGFVLLVLITSALAVVGSFLERRIVLMMALAVSIITALAFLGDVNNAVSQACGTLQPPLNCISGLFGYGAGGLRWGFDSGYYLFLVSALLLALGLAPPVLELHRPD